VSPSSASSASSASRATAAGSSRSARLPAISRQRRALFRPSNGGYYYTGYGEVFRRYFFRAKEQPLPPAAAA
jgi:hypothetical protein